MKYKVNEIFYSLQGEGWWTGTPMVFVRLSGCNLKCPWCDTDHRNGVEMSADEILSKVREASQGLCRRVCITGGEPLLQLDRALVKTLRDAGLKLHLETNGTLPLPCPPGLGNAESQRPNSHLYGRRARSESGIRRRRSRP